VSYKVRTCAKNTVKYDKTTIKQFSLLYRSRIAIVRLALQQNSLQVLRKFVAPRSAL